MYEDNYQALANAIILQAVKDFQALTSIDGPALLNRIMREMDEKYEKN